jgi:hypothetical protein
LKPKNQMPKYSPDQIRSIAADDIQTIMEQLSKRLPQDEELIMISGLLVTAGHLLKNPRVESSHKPNRRPSLLDDDEDEQADPSEPSEPRPRRSLAREWSGRLPGQLEPPPVIPKRRKKGGKVTREQRAAAAARFENRAIGNGVVVGQGFEPDDFKVVRNVNPMSMCKSCQGPIGEHPPDENMPMENNNYPVIACDQTRIYLG